MYSEGNKDTCNWILNWARRGWFLDPRRTVEMHFTYKGLCMLQIIVFAILSPWIIASICLLCFALHCQGSTGFTFDRWHAMSKRTFAMQEIRSKSRAHYWTALQEPCIALLSYPVFSRHLALQGTRSPTLYKEVCKKRPFPVAAGFRPGQHCLGMGRWNFNLKPNSQQQQS